MNTKNKYKVLEKMDNQMKEKITGEEVFQIWSDKFTISASESGYTLNWSADGKTWTAENATEVGENLMGVNFSAGAYVKLAGLSGSVWLNYTV